MNRDEILQVDLPNLIDLIGNPETNSIEITNLLNTIKYKIKESGSQELKHDFRNMEEIMREHDIVDVQRKKGIGLYTTGYNWLDKHLTEGLAPQKVSIIAGRPGTGKSSLIVCLMRNLSNKKVHTAQFALEMNSISLIDKFLSTLSGIPLEKIIKNRKDFSKEEEEQFLYEKDRLRENKYLYFDDRVGIKLDYIKDQIQRLQETTKQEYWVIFIDLFNKIRDFNINSGNLPAQYEQHLTTIQQIARELKVHFSLVAQISREAEKGKNIWKYRPNLNNLKNAGAYEEVGDLILLLFRAKYYDEKLPDDILEVEISKQRMGKANDRVNFLFQGETTNVFPTTLFPHDQRKGEVG